MPSGLLLGSPRRLDGSLGLSLNGRTIIFLVINEMRSANFDNGLNGAHLTSPD